MSMHVQTKCMICENDNYKVVFSYDEPDQYEVVAGVSRKGYFRKWIQCHECGFYYSIYSRKAGLINNIENMKSKADRAF